MLIKSTKFYLFLVLFCASFLSFSQDDGMELLKDSDDKLIKFENHYFEALKYKAIGNYSRAITELEKCQQLYVDDKSILFELSKNYFFINKLNEAELYIEKALKLDKNNYWLLEHAKKLYLRAYNYPKTIEIEQRIIAQRPEKKEDLVLVYLQAKKYKEADELIKELESQNQLSSRLDHFKKLVKNHYKNTSDIVVQEVKTNENKTLEDLKIEFKNDKQYDVLKELLKQSETNNNFDDLLGYSNKGLELFPAQPFVYLMNAKALINSKKYNNAIDVLNTGIDFVVDDVTLEAHFYKQLAICYLGLNKQDKALEFNKKASELLKKQ